MRRTDWADVEANRLYDMVRDGDDDDAVMTARDLLELLQTDMGLQKSDARSI